MAGSETSFDSYTFTYNWKINALETRLHNPIKLSSPSFSSPSGTRPATKWMLTIFKSKAIQNDDTWPPSCEQSLSLDLTRLACSPKAATRVTNVGHGLSLDNLWGPGLVADLYLPPHRYRHHHRLKLSKMMMLKQYGWRHV